MVRSGQPLLHANWVCPWLWTNEQSGGSSWTPQSAARGSFS